MFPGLTIWYCITTVCSSLGTTTSPAQHPWIALVLCVGLRPLWISLLMLTRLLLLFLFSSGHTILSEDPDLVSSTHAAWLTTFCFSSSVRSGVFFLALWVPALACAHPRPHTDTNTRSYTELKVMKPLKYESRDHVLYILESFANHSAAAVFSAHCVLKQIGRREVNGCFSCTESSRKASSQSDRWSSHLNCVYHILDGPLNPCRQLYPQKQLMGWAGLHRLDTN